MTPQDLFTPLHVNTKEKEKKLEELAALVTEIFEFNKQGKKLFSYLKKLYISAPNAAILPTRNSILSQFGSIETYVGFRSGQANVIFYIESLINQFKNKDQQVSKQTKENEIYG